MLCVTASLTSALLQWHLGYPLAKTLKAPLDQAPPESEFALSEDSIVNTMLGLNLQNFVFTAWESSHYFLT